MSDIHFNHCMFSSEEFVFADLPFMSNLRSKNESIILPHLQSASALVAGSRLQKTESIPV